MDQTTWSVISAVLGLTLSGVMYLQPGFAKKWPFHVAGVSALIFVYAKFFSSGPFGPVTICTFLVLAACSMFFLAHVVGMPVANLLVGTASAIKLRRTYDQAEAAEARRDYAGAERLYLEAIPEDEKDPEPLRRLADLYVKMERWDEASTFLRRAVDLTHDIEAKFMLIFQLADMLDEDLTNPAAALAELERLARDHPHARGIEYVTPRIESLRRRLAQRT